MKIQRNLSTYYMNNMVLLPFTNSIQLDYNINCNFLSITSAIPSLKFNGKSFLLNYTEDNINPFLSHFILLFINHHIVGGLVRATGSFVK